MEEKDEEGAPSWFDETCRFESLRRYSEIQVSQSISGSENGKRPA